MDSDKLHTVADMATPSESQPSTPLPAKKTDRGFALGDTSLFYSSLSACSSLVAASAVSMSLFFTSDSHVLRSSSLAKRLIEFRTPLVIGVALTGALTYYFYTRSQKPAPKTVEEVKAVELVEIVKEVPLIDTTNLDDNTSENVIAIASAAEIESAHNFTEDDQSANNTAEFYSNFSTSIADYNPSNDIINADFLSSTYNANTLTISNGLNSASNASLNSTLGSNQNAFSSPHDNQSVSLIDFSEPAQVLPKPEEVAAEKVATYEAENLPVVEAKVVTPIKKTASLLDVVQAAPEAEVKPEQSIRVSYRPSPNKQILQPKIVPSTSYPAPSVEKEITFGSAFPSENDWSSPGSSAAPVPTSVPEKQGTEKSSLTSFIKSNVGGKLQESEVVESKVVESQNIESGIPNHFPSTISPTQEDNLTPKQTTAIISTPEKSPIAEKIEESSSKSPGTHEENGHLLSTPRINTVRETTEKSALSSPSIDTSKVSQSNKKVSSNVDNAKNPSNDNAIEDIKQIDNSDVEVTAINTKGNKNFNNAHPKSPTENTSLKQSTENSDDNKNSQRKHSNGGNFPKGKKGKK